MFSFRIRCLLQGYEMFLFYVRKTTCIHTFRCCESDAILTSDYRSNEIAYKIHDHILSTTRRCPTIIMNILHRSWLDPNRYDDDGLATFREEVAEKIYTWYHGNMTALVAKLNGFGIIFDMHGYYNSLVNWTIIGNGSKII